MNLTCAVKLEIILYSDRGFVGVVLRLEVTVKINVLIKI